MIRRTKNMSVTEINELARLIVPLSQVLHRATGAGALIERARLPGRQLQALVALVEAGPLPVGELGRRLGIAASTATELAERMCAAGRAERVAVPGDRRRCLLCASAAGRREADRYLRLMEGAVRRRLARLSSPDRAELLAAFRAVLRIMGEPGTATGGKSRPASRGGRR
jgi:MarR family transcriptional regulator, organic hydroperoxide resistance regulator